MARNAIRLFVLAVCFGNFALAQAAPAAQQDQPAQASEQQPAPPSPQDLEKRPKLTGKTRVELIGTISSEFVRVRKALPLGFKAVTLATDGKIEPSDGHLHQLAITNGIAAKVGDRVQITNVVFKDKAIYVEINGGPKRKSKWYDHVSVGVGGAMRSTADTNQTKAAGAGLTLEFKGHVPEMTGGELKQLLSPLLDFSLKTAGEIYAETLPPKIKQAVKNHEVLVGMNRDMVILAKDRPGQKIREKDAQGKEYEEWIYGAVPQDVIFVRLVGDEVTQVKIMKMGAAPVLKTEKEVQVNDGVVSLASVNAQGKNPAPPVPTVEESVPRQLRRKRPIAGGDRAGRLERA